MSTSAAPPASVAPPFFEFSQNERVLCYHGPLIYEAKVLKIQNIDETTAVAGITGPHYFVHYKGWKQTWDEWVPSIRLLKYNEANLEAQKMMQRASAPSASAAASSARAQKMKDGATGSSRVGRKDGTRGTKRGRDEDEGLKKPDLKLELPPMLKVLLVDDWEAVTKNNQLVSLPRSPTVVELLDQFQTYVKENKPARLREPELLIPHVVSGLIVYFDRSLGANLLYRFERPQYADVRKRYKTGQQVIIGQEKEVSAVYGAEHLLRMIVSLPGMVASSSLDPESVALVRDYVNELLEWMVREKNRIFQTQYEQASIQYQNISRT